MANLVEVAQRVPTAVAEVTGQKLSGVINNIKDTLNPANFFQAAGGILAQEAPILGSISGVVGDLTSSLLGGGGSPEEATEVNTEETSDNTKQVKETNKENLSENKKQTRNLITNKQILESLNIKLDTLSNEQTKTTEALLGNNNALENVTNNQVENIQNTESLVNQATSSEFKDLETQREAQRLQEDSIAVQEENKESGLDLQTILGGVSAGITGLVSFLKDSFIGKMIKGLSSGLAPLLSPLLGRRAAPDIGGPDTDRNNRNRRTRPRGRVGSILGRAGDAIGGATRGTGRAAAGVARGAARAAAGAAKFIPGIGLAVTGIMGLFDGVTAGVEEYKKSGKIGEAVKQGFAGTLSGLTFGLISQESISNGFDSISSMFSDGWEKSKEIFSDVGKFLYNSDTGEVLGFKIPTLEELKGMIADFNISETLAGLGKFIYNSETGEVLGFKLPTMEGLKEIIPSFEIPELPNPLKALAEAVSAWEPDGMIGNVVKDALLAILPDVGGAAGGAEAETEEQTQATPQTTGEMTGAQAQALPPVQRTAEMVGTQSALADTERTQTGGGNNVVNAPQVNNNVTNNNMGSQQPTPKNQDSTLDRYGSSEMAFIGA